MKELDNLMEALEKRGCIKSLHIAAKIVGYPEKAKDDEEAQKIIDNATRDALRGEFERDDKLCELFADYCYEIGMNALIKELNIKVADKGEKSKVPEFLKGLIDEIFK